jgi:hypothetical protein
MTNRKLAHTAPFGSLPTAGGGMARAAYSAALKARLDIDPLLKSSGLTAVQLKDPDTRIAVKNQIEFVNQVAGALGLRFCRKACKDDFITWMTKDNARLRKWLGWDATKPMCRFDDTAARFVGCQIELGHREGDPGADRRAVGKCARRLDDVIAEQMPPALRTMPVR